MRNTTAWSVYERAAFQKKISEKLTKEERDKANDAHLCLTNYKEATMQANEWLPDEASTSQAMKLAAQIMCNQQTTKSLRLAKGIMHATRAKRKVQQSGLHKGEKKYNSDSSSSTPSEREDHQR